MTDYRARATPLTPFVTVRALFGTQPRTRSTGSSSTSCRQIVAVLMSAAGFGSEDQYPNSFLTTRSGTVDKVVGLKISADEYVTKLFDMLELISRIEALLRRAGTEGGGSSIDLAQ